MRPFDISPLMRGDEHLVVLTTRTLKSVSVCIGGSYFEELYTVCSGVVLSGAEAAAYMAATQAASGKPSSTACDRLDPHEVLAHVIQQRLPAYGGEGRSGEGGHWGVRDGSARLKYRDTMGKSDPDPPSLGPLDGNSGSDGLDRGDRLHNYRTHVTVKLIYRIPVRKSVVGCSLPPADVGTSVVNVPQWLWHWHPMWSRKGRPPVHVW